MTVFGGCLISNSIKHPFLMALLLTGSLAISKVEIYPMRRLWWKKKRPLETVSPANNCILWLHIRPRSIVYNYGVNTSASGAGALLVCLLKYEAVEARLTIQEIVIVLPLSGLTDPTQQPLLILIDSLPGLRLIRYNSITSCQIFNLPNTTQIAESSKETFRAGDA